MAEVSGKGKGESSFVTTFFRVHHGGKWRSRKGEGERCEEESYAAGLQGVTWEGCERQGERKPSTHLALLMYKAILTGRM